MTRLFALLAASSVAAAAPVPKDAGIPDPALRAWRDRGAHFVWYGLNRAGEWDEAADPDDLTDPVPLARFLPNTPETLKGLPPLGRPYAVAFCGNSPPDGWETDLPAPRDLVAFLVFAGYDDDDGFDPAIYRPLASFPNLARLAITGRVYDPAAAGDLLKSLPALKSLHLADTGMGAAGYAAAAEATGLVDLDLVRMGTTADAMAKLVALPNLQRLRLQCGVSAAAMAQFKAMPRLRALTLYGERISPAKIAHIVAVPGLEELAFPFVVGGINLRSAKLLGTAKKLRRLDLSGAEVLGKGLNELKGLTELRDVSLCDWGDQAMLRVVGNWTKLERLHLGKAIHGDPFAHLGPLTELRDLTADVSYASADTVATLGKFAKLRRLRLERASQGAGTDLWLAQVAGMADLRELDLWGSALSDAGLAHIAGLTKLRRLRGLCGTITEAGLKHLDGLTDLYELEVELNVAGVGLKRLARFTRLRRLTLCAHEVADGELAHLAGLSELRILSLSLGKVTEAGLARLAPLPRLTDLQLAGVPLTQQAALSLYAFPNLHHVWIGRGEISEGDLAAVQEALPRCHVVMP